MRSVVVTKFVPWPPNSGEKRRVLGVVRALRDRGEVTLCAFAGPDEDAEPLIAEGIDVRSVPLRRTPATLLRGLVVGRSVTAARFWDARLAGLVTEATAVAPDVLLVEHVQLLPYAHRRRAGMRVIDMHNVESVLLRRMSESSIGLRRMALAVESRAVRRLERRSSAVDLVMVVSDVDRAALERVVQHTNVVVVPNAWDEPSPLPPAPDPVACFVALLSWGPNVDAAVWFCREVWPRVVAALPDARLQLVGRNPADAVRALVSPTVEVTGTVPDLTPWYARARVALAPLLAGGGSRLKILEALAAGRPVVASSVGVEGLEDLIGRGVVVADDPADMAAALVDLLRDPVRSQALGKAGTAAVAADHSWGAAVRPLLAALPADR